MTSMGITLKNPFTLWIFFTYLYAASSSDWSTYGHDAQKTGADPSEIGISAINAPYLSVAWSVKLSGSAVSQPLIAYQFDTTPSSKKRRNLNINTLLSSASTSKKSYLRSRGLQVYAQCPVYNGEQVGCSDCQQCPDGSVCPPCTTCPLYNGEQVGCHDCQTCPDGSICPQCSTQNNQHQSNAANTDTTTTTTTTSGGKPTGFHAYSQCPMFENQQVDCQGCQGCPDGSVCPPCTTCPLFNGEQVGCHDCQTCPDGSLCPQCSSLTAEPTMNPADSPPASTTTTTSNTASDVTMAPTVSDTTTSTATETTTSTATETSTTTATETTTSTATDTSTTTTEGTQDVPGLCPIYENDQAHCNGCETCPDGTTCNTCSNNPFLDTEGFCTDTEKTIRDVAYLGDVNGYFYAIDVDLGCKIWQKTLGSYTNPNCADYPSYGILGSPVFDRTHNRIYTVTNGTFYALSMKTGKTIWKIKSMYDRTLLASYGALTLVRNIVYVTLGSMCSFGDYNGGIWAIDIHTHKVINSFYPSGVQLYGGDILGSPGVTVKKIVHPTDPTTLYLPTGHCSGDTQDAYYCEKLLTLDSQLNVLQSVGFTDDPNFNQNNPTNDFASSATYFNDFSEGQSSGCNKALITISRVDGYFILLDADTLNILQTIQLSDPQGQGFTFSASWDSSSNVLIMATNAGYDSIQAGLVGYNLTADCQLTQIWNTPVKDPTSVTIIGPPTQRVAITSGYYSFTVVEVTTGISLYIGDTKAYSIAPPTVKDQSILIAGHTPGSLVAFIAPYNNGATHEPTFATTTTATISHEPTFEPTLEPTNEPTFGITDEPTLGPTEKHRNPLLGLNISSQAAPPVEKPPHSLNFLEQLQYWYTHDTLPAALGTVGIFCCLCSMFIALMYLYRTRDKYGDQDPEDGYFTNEWDEGTGVRTSLFTAENPATKQPSGVKYRFY